MAELEKFLKSLREMNHHDWRIEKKLVEAGGIGKTVYIYPARGQGHPWRMQKHIEEFLAKGKDVYVVTREKTATKPTLEEIKHVYGTIIDRDLSPINPLRQTQHEFMDEFYHKKPTFDFDTVGSDYEWRFRF